MPPFEKIAILERVLASDLEYSYIHHELTNAG
jgi:hypothetical protein